MIPPLDIEDEIRQLKEHCEKGLAASDPFGLHPDLRKKLAFIEDDVEGEGRMFSATLDYFATGEGRTIAFVASYAHSPRKFMEHLIRKLRGHWFVIGVTLYEGMPVDDEIYDFLFSDKMREHQAQLPYFNSYLWQHYNFS